MGFALEADSVADNPNPMKGNDMAFGQALLEVHIYRDYNNGTLEFEREFYSASWPNIVREINLANAEYIAGNRDYLLRVFCPWEGEELYIPK